MVKKRTKIKLKLFVLAALAIGIIGVLGWSAWQFTPGKRHQNLMDHARMMMEEKAWGESTVALRKALEIYPEDMGVRHMLMSSLFAEGKVDQGLTEIENILMMPPFGSAIHQQSFSEYYAMVRGAGARTDRMHQIAVKMRQSYPPELHWMADLLDARAEFLDQDFAKAAGLFAKLIDAGVKTYQVKLGYAQSQLATGENMKAAAMFKELLKGSPDAVEVLNGYAATLTLQGKADEALDVFIRASLVGNPPKRESLLSGGLFALNQGKVAEAKKYFIKRVIKFYPEDRIGKLMRMRFNILVGDKPSFVALYEGMKPEVNSAELAELMGWSISRGRAVWALELLDNHTPQDMPQDDVTTYRIMAMIALRRLDEAGKLADTISDANKQTLVIAELDMRSGRLADAQKRFSSLIEAEKDSPTSMTARAKQGLARVQAMNKALASADVLPRSRILLGQGKAEEVLKLIDGVKQADADLQLMGVMALLQLKRNAEAMKHLDVLLAEYPEMQSGWLIWGRKMAEKNPETALAGLLKAASSAAAGGPQLESLIGELQYKLGQHDKAIATWAKVASRWPNTLAANVSNVFRAQAYMMKKEWESAVGIWQQVLEIARDDPVTLNNLAYSMLQSHGDLKRAEQLAIHALRVKPGDAAIEDTLQGIRQAMQQGGSNAGG
ncbi:MAG: tetratricopeptide repeat protein [Mariprofundaceae bacterium]|nr:tetratricopeptide repeat protein [Mariprofundaceae bacterium]